MPIDKLDRLVVGQQILQKRLFVVVGKGYVANKEDAVKTCAAIHEGGGIPELTCRVGPKIVDYVSSVAEYARDLPEDDTMVVAVGTIQNLDELESVVKAGAEVAISPSYGRGGLKDPLAFVKYCKNEEVFSIPAGLSPNELSFLLEQPEDTAPDAVKVFPAWRYGPERFGGVLSTLSKDRHNGKLIIPTGGVNLSNYDKYLRVGFQRGFEIALASSQPIKTASSARFEEYKYKRIRREVRAFRNRIDEVISEIKSL